MISGDLFDNNNLDENVYNEVISKFESIPDTQIYIAPGTHDKTEDMYFYEYSLLPPNVHVFKDNKILQYDFNNDIVIYGVNNQGYLADCNKCKLDRNKVNIFMMHNPLTEEENIKDYEALVEATVNENMFNYYAFGYIHDFKRFSFINNNVVAYPGSPYHIENNKYDRGYICGTIDGDWIEVNFEITKKRKQ